MSQRERHSEKDPLAELVRLLGEDEAFCALSPSREDNSLNWTPGQNEEPPPSGSTLVPVEWDGEASPPANDRHAGRLDADMPQEFYHASEDRVDARQEHRRGAGVVAAVIVLIALMGTAGGFAYFAWSSGPRGSDEGLLAKIAAPANKGLEDKKSLSQARERNLSTAEPVLAGQGTPEDAPSRQMLPLTHGMTSGTEPAPPALPAPQDTAPPTSADAQKGAMAGTGSPNLGAKPQDERREPPPTHRPVAGQGYLVQLSSQRSDAAAQATAHALQLKHPNVFGGRQPFIRRSDLGARGVYFRVLLGTFASVEEAKQICSELKKAGGECIVQRD